MENLIDEMFEENLLVQQLFMSIMDEIFKDNFTYNVCRYFMRLECLERLEKMATLKEKIFGNF